MHVQRWVSLLFCLLAFLPAVAVLAQETETRGGRSLTAGFHAIGGCPICLVGVNFAYNILGRKINQVGLHASAGMSLFGGDGLFTLLALHVSLWETHRAGRFYDAKLSAGPALFLVEPGGFFSVSEPTGSGLLDPSSKARTTVLVRPGGVFTGHAVFLPVRWLGIGIQLYTLAFAPVTRYMGSVLALSAPTPGLVLYVGQGNY